MTADARLKSFIDRVLRLKETGASREEIRAAYMGLSGDEKVHVGLCVRLEWQRRQGWRVYFAKFPRCGLIKIGISRNVTKRLATLSRIKGEEAELLLDFPGIFFLEGWCHADFKEWRVEGEWFRLCDASLRKIEQLRADGPVIRLEAA